MKRKYHPRHARLRERHPITEMEIANVALVALGDLISFLSVLIALLALHQSPTGQAVAPAQFHSIICFDGRAPEQCQFMGNQSMSP